ncbi:MAG: TetR/AcrR family transcriptional regulator, partial [Flavobacteriaceae bacterium]|nr:TetR/AcrR family transcriptional regulator [Flavobacteriaceae bacterium]
MNRKQLILETSLELFAKNGVVGTTTKSIANEAGVSEGLLFRHYQSKEGLVKALKKLAADKVRILAQEIIDLTEPKDILRLTILSLTKIPFEDYALWKLILGIKFQSELADESFADVI